MRGHPQKAKLQRYAENRPAAQFRETCLFNITTKSDPSGSLSKAAYDNQVFGKNFATTVPLTFVSHDAPATHVTV